MKIIYEKFKDEVIYNKITATLTEYESESKMDYVAKSFYCEHFYSLLCEIQNIIDRAEKERV